MSLFGSTSCLAPFGGCAFLALWVVSCSAFAWVLLCVPPLFVSLCLFVCLLFCLCLLCGLCVPPPLHLGSLLCGLWYLWSPPSLPPSVVSVWRPGPVFFCFTGPSLWVSGCFLRRPGCLALMLGVLWCFASSLHCALWQQRPLALCGVVDLPSTPWGICCCGALYSLTEVFIFMMIQDPPWTPLSYTLATLC